MIKKFLLRFLLKLYNKEFREINKIDPGEELEMYLLNDSQKTLKLIKAVMTSQIMREFESDNLDEKRLAKGAALVLKIMKDSHIAALEINQIEDEGKRLEMWERYRNKNRTN